MEPKDCIFNFIKTHLGFKAKKCFTPEYFDYKLFEYLSHFQELDKILPGLDLIKNLKDIGGRRKKVISVIDEIFESVKPLDEKKITEVICPARVVENCALLEITFIIKEQFSEGLSIKSFKPLRPEYFSNHLEYIKSKFKLYEPHGFGRYTNYRIFSEKEVCFSDGSCIRAVVDHFKFLDVCCLELNDKERNALRREIIDAHGVNLHGPTS